MTKDDTNKLFFLLKQFYPKANKSKTVQLAWEMALAPYDYGQVKEAALSHVREKKFFPDVSELIALIQKGRDNNSEDAYAASDDDISGEYAYLKKYIIRDTEINPVTRYAAENCMTVGEAERAMGITWEAAQYGRKESDGG